MGALIALLNLLLLFITTLLFDGSGRYFQVSTKNGTAPLVVSLDATYLLKAKRGNTFIWNFGNGETLKTTSPIINYTYLKAGTYSLSLTYQDVVVDKKGRSTIKSSNQGGVVKIVVAPKPNLLPTAKISCSSPAFLKVDCHAEGSVDSDGSIVSYKYNWGDSSEFTASQPSLTSYTYSTGGEKIIRLTVKDNQGAESFIETSVSVLENIKPTASFSCTKNGIVTINCQSTSTDPDQEITNFAWTLDDGTTYSAKSFTHTFNKRNKDVALTSHLVSLEVVDDNGLKDSISSMIDVDLEPLRLAPRSYVKIYMDQTKIDLRAFIARTQFAIKSAVYTVYDANNVLLHTIPITDFYQNHSTKIDLLSYGNYRVDFKVVDFRDQEVITQRSFTLMDDTTKLRPFVGFRAIQSNINTVYINVNPSFDYDENLSIISFEIDLGNGEKKVLTNDTFLTHTYAAPGVYNITVLAKTNHGTERSFTQAVTITDQEVAPISPDPTFAYRIYSFAQNVSFYNEKSGTPNGNIISYMWDFGDGSTGAGETQAHFYLPGSYIVSLTVVDSAGLTSTQTQKITIDNTGDDIVANIDCSLSSPYLDLTQRCKINALDKFNEINRIRVVWGDNTAFNLATPFDPRQGVYYPQKKYAAEGTYPIRLIVNTSRGIFKIHDISLKIIERKPVASIQCYVNNLLVFCDGLGSYDPKGSSLKYVFDFGDGHIEENFTGTLSHAYTEAGMYTVKLIVTDQTNLSSAASETVVQPVKPINQLPVAIFGCDSPAPHTIYCWDNGSYDADGQITIRKLDFDDNTSDFLSTENTTRHQFSSGGEHVVTLTVIDNDGGTTTISKTINVTRNNPPIANFECNTYGPQRMNCYSTSIEKDSGDQISNYNWEFGDGTTQEGLSGGFNHTYGANPTYKVKLTVQDQFGGSSHIEKEITMIENKAPVADFNCTSSSNGNYICSSTSYDLDGMLVSHKWTIDGQVIEGESIMYEFSRGGEFAIKLAVQDDLGKSVLISKVITVNKLYADFNCVTSEILKLKCTLDEAVNLTNVAISKFVFDEKSFKIGNDVEYVFSDFGEHKVKLEITLKNGEVVKNEKSFLFPKTYLKPKANFSTYVNEDNKVIFNASSSLFQGRSIVKYHWDFGDGETYESSHWLSNHRYGNTGFYNIALTVTDSIGVTSTLTQNIYVYDTEVPEPGEFNNDTILGVDVDADGVRDDIQRWINFESKDNIAMKSAMRNLAKNWQELIFKSNDKSQSRTLYNQNQKLAIYLYGVVEDDEKSEQLINVMKFLYFKTEERYAIYLKISSNNAGAELTAMPSSKNERLNIMAVEK